MSIKIFHEPPLPPAIKQAFDDNKLAVFIGAGVSRLIGCDGWDELAKNLIRRCYDEGLINFKEKESLSSISDHKKTITICHHILKSDNVSKYYDEMGKALKQGEEIENPNIYKEIIFFRGPFITTNVDTHFDKQFRPSNVISNPGDFNKNNILPNTLYHIHGSFKDKENMVFSVSTYFKRYNEDRNFKLFLEKVFADYTVLFLGYGLSEYEVLDFVLKNRHESPRHFILSAYYRGEENILKYEEAYYADLGINVIPFEKDEKGYSQLHGVINNWTNEIKQVTNYLPNAFKEIDEAVI